MGRKISLLLAALLLLGGCYAAQPLEDPSPSAAETSTPTAPPTPTPTPTSEPTQEVKELWGFPIDDTHDAFEVDTKGKLGNVLVTVERGEELGEEGYCYKLSVWDKSDLTTPIQTLEEAQGELGGGELMDANFDGYTDFLYMWNPMSINWPFSLYVWDEGQEQFHFVTTLWGRGVKVDEAEQTVQVYVHHTNATGAHETYRWEDGELVCFRKAVDGEENDDPQGMERVTYELIDGAWQEISREPSPMMG